MPTVQQLQGVPLFEGLSSEGLDRLAQQFRTRQVPAGQAIFYAGDEGGSLCIILRGRASVQITTDGGTVLHIADRCPGDHIGELSLLDGEPRSADVIALEACTLLVLGRREFERAVVEHPEISLNIMKSLAQRLRQQADHLSRFASLDALGRVCMILTELGSDGPVTLSQRSIAERAGLSRETVNRSLTQLAAVGAVRNEGREIHIVDPVYLRQRSMPV